MRCTNDVLDTAARATPVDGLHTDLQQRVVLHAADARWQPSDTPGVERRMLACLGNGQTNATCLVRCAPGSQFPHHGPAGGEEILVLEGVFSDETGDHPAGTYLRRPAGTRAAPTPQAGCLLYIKRGQFAPDDTASVRINTRDAALWQAGVVPGLSTLLLHSRTGASTLMLRSAPNTWFDTHTHPVGEELLVVDGVLHDDMGCYPRHSWMRSPRWSRHAPHTGDVGALSLVKLGDLGWLAGPEA